VLEDALWLLPGLLAGILTMLILWWTIRRVRPTTDSDHAIRNQVWRAYILRLGIVSGCLMWAARQGIGPLLWAFGGLMACRWVILVRWSGGLQTRANDQAST
jgi:hypothetical protein